MAKFDLKAAYRQVPVHPDDRHLLGRRAVCRQNVAFRVTFITTVVQCSGRWSSFHYYEQGSAWT